jgi:hypothetical protein
MFSSICTLTEDLMVIVVYNDVQLYSKGTPVGLEHLNHYCFIYSSNKTWGFGITWELL